ncbi:uncharacterized protein LOC130565751 [Triplophysa rosa]|uniref:uncharacterized protein LOC130565751 n=1 Tax=Triplophysa rosa TaxID=992332 RepID=UPI002545F6B3|nr:uncharacterized protein LOC130565751 [Triplophysa rosa]
MVPDTPVPRASGLLKKAERRDQLSTVFCQWSLPATDRSFPPKEARCDTDLDVGCITDWSVCNNIQQNSELPSHASAEDVENKPQEQHGKEKKGIFKRTWKAVKHPFRRCESRVEPIVLDTPVPCASDLQQTADREQISSERPSVSVSSATVKNQPQGQRVKETLKRTPLLSVPPMFQPSDGESVCLSVYHHLRLCLWLVSLG